MAFNKVLIHLPTKIEKRTLSTFIGEQCPGVWKTIGDLRTYNITGCDGEFLIDDRLYANYYFYDFLEYIAFAGQFS